MQNIPIVKTANQSFSAVLDGSYYSLAIKETNGCMSVNIARNSAAVVSGARAVAGTLLIPYPYLQQGNFLFVTAGLALPYWDQFGITQSLIYVSPAEIAAIAEAVPSFLQYGALPIRYKVPMQSGALLTESGLILETEDGQAIDLG